MITVTVEKSEQYTAEEWRVVLHSRIFTAETTLREVLEWADSPYGYVSGDKSKYTTSVVIPIQDKVLALEEYNETA